MKKATNQVAKPSKKRNSSKLNSHGPSSATPIDLQGILADFLQLPTPSSNGRDLDALCFGLLWQQVQWLSRGAWLLGGGKARDDASQLLEDLSYRIVRLTDKEDVLDLQLKIRRVADDFTSNFATLEFAESFAMCKHYLRHSCGEERNAELRSVICAMPALDEQMWKDVRLVVGQRLAAFLDVGHVIGEGVFAGDAHRLVVLGNDDTQECGGFFRGVRPDCTWISRVAKRLVAANLDVRIFLKHKDRLSILLGTEFAGELVADNESQHAICDAVNGLLRDLFKCLEKPIWDKKNKRLSYHGRVVREVRVLRGDRIVEVLDAFADANWNETINMQFKRIPADNLESNQQRARDSVTSLNKGLVVLQFRASGSTIHWSVVSTADFLNSQIQIGQG